MIEPASPDVVEDDTAEPASPDVAVDETAEPATPEVVQEDTTEPSAPVLAEDPAPADDADAMAAEEPMEMDGEADAMAGDAVDPAAGEGMMAEGEWAPIDLATFSADRLIGADIVTANDETVASIEDVLLNDDGTVDNIVAKFGGFLGFGANRVLLQMDEIEVLAGSEREPARAHEPHSGKHRGPAGIRGIALSSVRKRRRPKGRRRFQL